MAYYSIDDILTEQETVPVQMTTDIIKLGHLDPNTDNPDLPAKTKIELPMWLVGAVTRENQKMLNGRPGNGLPLFDVKVPKVFTKPYCEALNADATVVNLAEWNEHFYEFGMRFAKLRSDPSSGDLTITLQDCFNARYRRVMDASQNAISEDTSELTKSYDQLEKALFLAGHVSDREYTDWKRRRADKISTAMSLESARRKRRKTGP
jgi:hypothetical protein